MLNKTTVKDIIKSRGTRFCTVTFITKKGEKRTVNGMLKPATEIQLDHWLQPMLDVHKKRMVSFYWIDVQDIR